MADLRVAASGANGGPSMVGWFTDRHGGASEAPYAEANLATHVGDDTTDVQRNRQALSARIGAPVVWMQQVHGADVTVVDAPRDEPVRDVDALVTTTTDLALAVLVADCVPVLLYDPDASVLAVAHAGRRGLAAGVLVRTVDVMTELGADAARLQVWLGPSICGLCYEVPAAMRDEVEITAPGSATTTRSDTAGIDLRAGLRAQLQRRGAPTAAIRDVGPCTSESSDHYSHRRDGVTGRFAGVAMLRP